LGELILFRFLEEGAEVLMIMNKDRTLEVGQKVRVYLNLNMMGRFSIQDQKTGLVVGYADSVLLKDVQFQIRKSGQDRARKERRRNVHALAVGIYMSADVLKPESLKRIGYYNPFLVDTFVDEDTQEPLLQAGMIFCHKKRVYF
jgi:hypothetical protein